MDRNGPFRFGPIFRNEISKNFVSKVKFRNHFEMIEIDPNLIEIYRNFASINFEKYPYDRN